MNKTKLYLALTGGLAFGVSMTVFNYVQNNELNFSGVIGALVWVIVTLLLSAGKNK
jgi:uncharacterized membrane protein YjjB (DUF3815 family)